MFQLSRRNDHVVEPNSVRRLLQVSRTTC